MAIAQAYFLIGNMAMTLSRAGNGFLTKAVGEGYLWGIAGVLIGTLLGGIVFERIPQRLFKRIILLRTAYFISLQMVQKRLQMKSK